MRPVRVILTKLTDARHRIELVREDAPRESSELETRSLLLHDFIHYAVEASAGIQDGFYGRLASGDTLASLTHPMSDAADGGRPASQHPDTPLSRLEPVVGFLTRFAKGELDEAATLRAFAALEASGSQTRPAWLDGAFLARVRGTIRQLTGHWKALRHGQSMELQWPPMPPTS
jgi:hypothetical protein